jgi:hypothetical protein
MNNTVVSVGCSWTYGHGVKPSETYSAYLQQTFPDYKFINGGHCGADTDYAIFSGVKLIEKYKPKVLIFQITTFDRYTLGTDGYRNFIKGVTPVTYNSNIYYEDESDNVDYVRVMGINDGVKTKYTHGSYIAKKSDIQEEMENSRMSRVNLTSYKNFVNIMYENLLHSEYENDKKINNLFLFKEYLEKNNIKSLWFSWIAEPEQNFLNKILPKELYINPHVNSWLKKNYPMRSFFIDKGYHVSPEGNKIIANQYIAPRLKELL